VRLTIAGLGLRIRLPRKIALLRGTEIDGVRSASDLRGKEPAKL
jgi:hypothetical protein